MFALDLTNERDHFPSGGVVNWKGNAMPSGKDQGQNDGDQGHGGGKPPQFDLIVNRKEEKWPRPEIIGREIKDLAGSPPEWVVNQIVGGPGDDPEVADDQHVQLDHQVPPKGIKRFVTRKPATNPGAI